MKLPCLIDTDWIIHYLNGRKDIIQELGSLKKGGLFVSVISLAELYEGIYYSTNPTGNEEALNGFLSGVSILGVEDEVCKVFGKERGRLYGEPISLGPERPDKPDRRAKLFQNQRPLFLERTPGQSW